MRSAVICLNGVLRPPHNRDGIDHMGAGIFEALKSEFRVILLDQTADTSTRHWLDVHEIGGYVRVYTPPPDFAPRTVADGRLRLLASIRNASGVDLIIEPDPSCAAEEIRAGYSVLLFASPQYQLDIWHPDHPRKPRAWDDIVTEINRQRMAKANDKRLKEIDD